MTGSIFWERSLFHSIKNTIVQFQEVPEVLQSKQGIAVSCCVLCIVCLCVYLCVAYNGEKVYTCLIPVVPLCVYSVC